MVTILPQKDLLISAKKIIQSPPGEKNIYAQVTKTFSPQLPQFVMMNHFRRKKTLETKTENFFFSKNKNRIITPNLFRPCNNSTF
jgi:hypothetical protein